MIEAYRQAAEKKVDLDKTVTLKKADKVPGSGILTNHFSDGATFPLRRRRPPHDRLLRQHGHEPRARRDRHRSRPPRRWRSWATRTPRSTPRSSAATPRSSPSGASSSASAAPPPPRWSGSARRSTRRSWSAPRRARRCSSTCVACDDKDKFPRFLPAGHEDRLQDREPRRRQDRRRDHRVRPGAGRPLRDDRRERGPALGHRQRRQPPLRRRRPRGLRALSRRAWRPGPNRTRNRPSPESTRDRPTTEGEPRSMGFFDDVETTCWAEDHGPAAARRQPGLGPW